MITIVILVKITVVTIIVIMLTKIMIRKCPCAANILSFCCIIGTFMQMLVYDCSCNEFLMQFVILLPCMFVIHHY